MRKTQEDTYIMAWNIINELVVCQRAMFHNQRAVMPNHGGYLNIPQQINFVRFKALSLENPGMNPTADFQQSVRPFQAVIKTGKLQEHSELKYNLIKMVAMPPTPLKNIGQFGLLFQLYGNIKTIFQTTNQSNQFSCSYF